MRSLASLALASSNKVPLFIPKMLSTCFLSLDAIPVMLILAMLGFSVTMIFKIPLFSSTAIFSK